MSTEVVINNIDIYGLLVFLLDDGWYSTHSKSGNLIISSGNLNSAQLKMIKNKFEGYGIKSALIGKRKDISIDSKYNSIILSYLTILFDNLLDIDVIKKKFGKIMTDYKNLLL